MLSRLIPLLVLVALTACSQANVQVGDSVKYEEAAPLLEGLTLDNETVSSTSLSDGPVILTFWATTCAPCRRELPMLEKLAKDYSDQNLTVLAINTGEAADEISEFLDGLSVDLPVVIDTNGTLMNRFEVLFLPTTYFIDSDWVLRYRTIGEPRPAQIERGMEAILAKS